MEWRKPLSRSAGGADGWRDDFPLDPELPRSLVLDCRLLELPVHPMFLLRLRTFIDWHTDAGHTVEVVPPDEPVTRHFFHAADVITGDGLEDVDDVVLPVTRLQNHLDVEEVAGRIQAVLEYRLERLAPLGQAAFMAVSELCGNAIEHGRNALGGYIAAVQLAEPRPRVAIAIADLGVGIPEHLRQRFPEWADDAFCIGQAMEERISGTGDPHRGNGFTETFEAALVSSLAAARLDVLSANGFVRTEIVQERRTVQPFPPARRRRGTWITYELVPA